MVNLVLNNNICGKGCVNFNEFIYCVCNVLNSDLTFDKNHLNILKIPEVRQRILLYPVFPIPRNIEYVLNLNQA